MAPGSSAVYFWYQPRKRGWEFGRHSLSNRFVRFGEQSLKTFWESDSDACGSGFLSVAMTEQQKAEAKELYQVLFLVLQDPDALKTLLFDKITKKKVRSMFVWEKMAPRFS
jgi:hypothetical protein